MCKTRRRTEPHHRRQPGRFESRREAEWPRGRQRVGDRDRDEVAVTLPAAVADGLLGVDELEERLSATWSARTHEQLAAVTADLPRDWIDDRARAVRDRKTAGAASTGLRYSAATFAVAVLVMVSIWLLTGGGYFWPIWPVAGWAPWLLLRWRPIG